MFIVRQWNKNEDSLLKLITKIKISCKNEIQSRKSLNNLFKCIKKSRKINTYHQIVQNIMKFLLGDTIFSLISIDDGSICFGLTNSSTNTFNRFKNPSL